MRLSPHALWAVLSGACLLFLSAATVSASEVRYLSGTGMDDTVDWEFQCSAGRNCGDWTTIPVPSNWELQGFGHYDYGRQDRKDPEVGRYRYRFEVPQSWGDRSIELVFEGVMTDADVRLNGESIGPVHQGGFYRFRFDVTERLELPGPNLLEVEVREASADRSVNRAERDADYWVFGGIFRPVYLEAFPAESIRRLAIDGRADGQLRVDAHLDGVTAARHLWAQVLDDLGEPVGAPFSGQVEAGQSQATLTTRAPDVRLWTAETPHLYRLAVCLGPLAPTADANADAPAPCGTTPPADDLLHQVSERFGFRTIEIRPGEGFYVNGVKVLLKGVNRHSFWPSTGRTTNAELSRQDVELMKSMNLNAVRMSHYPPDVHFLEATDELGLYVLDELAGWKDAYDTRVGRELVESMVTRDVNHPSIIAWNNGNEGGWNEALDPVFSEHDPQRRPVLHPRSEEPFAGLNTWHYRSYEVLEEMLSEQSPGGAAPIVLPTEFLHGLYDGGSGAGLADYWDLIRNSPRGGGGFLWALLDEGVERVDRGGEIDVAGNHAPDGIVGPYRQKEGSFFTIREIFSPVVLEAPAAGILDASFDGRFRLRNEHDFLDLQEIRFDWRLVDFPSPWEELVDALAAAAGTVRSGPISPGESGSVSIDLPTDWHRHDALQLDAVTADGQLIRTWSLPLHDAREARRSTVLVGGPRPVRTVDLENEIRLSAADVEVVLDKASGEITAVHAGNRTISLTGGPRLGKDRPKVAAIESRQVGDASEVGVRYRGSMESAWWRLDPSGWLRLRYRYVLTGARDSHGIGFDYPEDKMRSLRWRGLGPYRVWRNRSAGPTHGVWETARNDTVTGQSWQYPEFQGFFGGVYWARWLTEEGSFVVVFDQPDRFVHNFTPAVPDSPLETRLEFPPMDISFPHLIPAIGTKFHPAEDLGPDGRPRAALGAYSEDLYFYFGELPESLDESPGATSSAADSAAAESSVEAESTAESSSGH